MTTATEPQPAINWDAIPQELKDRPQWVVWKKAKRKGKLTKVPFQPRSGKEAKTTDPKTWTTFQVAALAYTTRPGKWDGVGFVFSAEDPYFGVDLDKCVDRDTGDFLPWPESLTTKCAGPLPCPAEIIRSLATYTELSPSETGTHSIGRGRLPGKGNRKDGQTAGIEMYDHARYFCFTGKRLPTAPTEIRECNGALTTLHRIVFGNLAGATGDRTQPI